MCISIDSFYILENVCQKQKDRCRSYDLNQDGYINKNEMLKRFPSQDSIHELFKQIDENQDDKITMKECLNLMRTIGYRIPSS